MRTMKTFVATVTVALVCAAAANAQSELQQLIEQTGIEAGPVAMRDVPGCYKRFHGSHQAVPF